MSTYIIDDKKIIKELIGHDNYNMIIIHIDELEKTVFYESDYTLYELIEKISYNDTIKILKKYNVC